MSKRFKILIAEDEDDLRQVVAEVLQRTGRCDCVQACDGDEALARIREEEINLLLTDLQMPRMGGAELLEQVHAHNPDIPVLVMTGYGTIEGAVELLRRGAYDYITKPFKAEELTGRVERALERLNLLAEIRHLRSFVDERVGADQIIGTAPAIEKLLRQLPSVARTEAAVMLYGESGTGKEVVARAIHAMSPRARASFVTVNCGALPESLLENELFGHVRGAFTDAREDYDGLVKQADGGTLFLDEIGEIPLALQVKLLRFLQEKEYRPLGSTKMRRVNARILAATNRDLKKAMADGSFREDLYYRLNIIPITLPPLRERKEDIPALANHFLREAVRQMRSPVEAISPLGMQRLMSHDWQGNVRELENKIQQLVALASANILVAEDVDLPVSSRPQMSLDDGELKSFKQAKREVVDTFERAYIGRVLKSTNGNVSEAARLARKHRRAFWEIMKKHGIRGREPVGEEEFEAAVSSHR